MSLAGWNGFSDILTQILQEGSMEVRISVSFSTTSRFRVLSIKYFKKVLKLFSGCFFFPASLLSDWPYSWLLKTALESKSALLKLTNSYKLVCKNPTKTALCNSLSTTLRNRNRCFHLHLYLRSGCDSFTSYCICWSPKLCLPELHST